ncbi:MAG: hypothetical protein NTY19_43680, partial [Planctomycetota bacterium]|nr:hypothetical protein [Planctomycetota bacterium]
VLTTNTVTINSTVNTLAAGLGGTVTITNAGLLDIAVAADMSLDGAFLQNGAGSVETAGDITTTEDAITFTTAVKLTDGHAVAFNTGVGIGTITFTSTLDGTTDFAEDLTLTAGLGNITFTGAVGATKDLGDIQINSALDVTFSAALNADSLTQSAGTGDTQIDGAVVINSSAGLDLALTTNTVTINSTMTTLNAGTVMITNTGLLDIAPGADMSLDGAFLQNGAGLVQTAGDITTTADDITFNTGVTLTDGHAVALSTGAGVIGNILFSSTLEGTTVFAEDLTLTGGLGSITFTGTVGATRDLGDVLINSAVDVWFKAEANVNSLVQSAGTGTTQFDGQVTTTAAGTNVDLTTATIDVNANAVTNGGNVVLNATGLSASIAINATITTSGGTVHVLADDDVTFGAAGAIMSAGGNVRVAADDDATADAGSGGLLYMMNGAVINAGYGTIDLEADEDITVGRLVTTNSTAAAVSITSVSGGLVDGNAGGEDIEAAGADAIVTIDTLTGVGSSNAIQTKITTLDLHNFGAGNVNLAETDAINVNRIDQDAASGTVTLTAGGSITLVAGLLGVSSLSGTVTLNAGGAGNLAINAAVVTVGGNVDLDAANNITSSVAGTITTTAAADSGVASGAVALDAAGTGSINLDGAIITTGATNNASAASAGGQVDIHTSDGPVELANVTTSGGAGIGTAGGAAGAMNITSADAGNDVHDVTITGPLTASGGAGTSLGAGGIITIAADGGVVDANSTGNDLTATSVFITAATGIAAADPLDTSAQFFNIVNSGPAAVHIRNVGTASATIVALKTVLDSGRPENDTAVFDITSLDHKAITFEQATGDLIVDPLGSGVSSGSVAVNGGSIHLQATNGRVSVEHEVSTKEGSDGGLKVSGSVDTKASLLYGEGHIILVGRDTSTSDIVITGIQTAATISLRASRDIIINGVLKASGDVTLIADAPSAATGKSDGLGGVWVLDNNQNSYKAQIIAGGKVFLQGSDVAHTRDSSDPAVSGLDSVYAAKFSGVAAGNVLDGVRIDVGATPDEDQVLAAGSITIQYTPLEKLQDAAVTGLNAILDNTNLANPVVNTIIDGVVRSQQSGADTINVYAVDRILISSILATAAGDITIHAPVLISRPRSDAGTVSTATFTTIRTADNLGEDQTLGTLGGNILFTNQATIDSQSTTADANVSQDNHLVLRAGKGNITFDANLGARQSGTTVGDYNGQLGTFTIEDTTGNVTFNLTQVRTNGAIDLGKGVSEALGSSDVIGSTVTPAGTGGIFLNAANGNTLRISTSGDDIRFPTRRAWAGTFCSPTMPRSTAKRARTTICCSPLVRDGLSSTRTSARFGL